MRWLLDTNVVSELRKPRPNAAVVRFLDDQTSDLACISVVTLAELRYGLELVLDKQRKLEIQHWLTHSIRANYADRILPISEDVMLQWCLMMAESKRRRRTPAQPDLFIAATCAVHGLTLVTRNVKDFADWGIQLLNPWEPLL